MKTITLHGFNPLNISSVAREFFKLRKKLFVDDMGWDIPHDDEIEFDQYDHLNTSYCIIVDDNRVVGGARILRTDTNRKGWSYMIKDASEGKISQIPSKIISDAPSNETTFEITRFTVDPSLDLDKRNAILKELSFSSYQCVANMGGEYAIALMSPLFLRWFRNIGIAADKLGPIVKGEESSYCVIGGQVENVAAARNVA